MKQFYKIISVFLTVFVGILSAKAYDFEIDRIYYNINEETNTVTVATNKNYEGELVIPSTVSYEDKEFVVTAIEVNAFRSCKSLTYVEIPASVVTIGDYAFAGCSSLKSIKVADDNPEFISIDGTLYNKDLTKLIQCPGAKTSVEIPASVVTIGYLAFAGCSSLISIEVADDNPDFISIDGILYNKDVTELIQCPGAKTSVEMPHTMTSINDSAFDGCKSLASIEIPEGIDIINMDCFKGCSSLTKVKLPNTLTTFSGYAFMNCSSLAELDLPESMTFIGYWSLLGCESLKSITCRALEVPRSTDHMFGHLSTKPILYVYEEVIEEYKNSYCAELFSSILPIDTLNVNELLTDKDTSIITVYNLNGVNVINTADKSQVEALPSGLYIINGKKVMIGK